MPLGRSYELKADVPPPMNWDEYERIISAKWQALLKSEDSKAERNVQEFLEQHPCMIPGPFGLIGTSGHSPWPAAMISHPILPGLSARIPDFMWIARTSDRVSPILIEIESPHKRWFTSAGMPRSELTQARDQITEWMIWFDKPQNVIQFREIYSVDRDLGSLRPFFLLIYGRRAEANRSTALHAKRASMARPNELLMTYDRLMPQRGACQYLCVKINARGYRAITIPPTLRLGPNCADELALIRDKSEAADRSPYLSEGRRKFLTERFPYWDAWSQKASGSSPFEIIDASDSE
jgi:hypothetical protein